MATDPKSPSRSVAKSRARRSPPTFSSSAFAAEDHVPAFLAAPSEGEAAPVVTPVGDPAPNVADEIAIPEDVIAFEALAPAEPVSADRSATDDFQTNPHDSKETSMDVNFDTATDAAQTTVDAAASTASTATDKAQAMFADVNDRAKSAMERSQRAMEEMNEFSKGNIEALVESGKIAAKGIETLGQEAAEYSRRQLEGMTATMKSFASVKSPTEFFKLQSDYVRQSFDAIVAETSKNTEAMLKLAGEVAQPLSTRVALAAEKVKIAA